MLRFRLPHPDPVRGDVADLFVVGQWIDDAMRPGHFFVDPELRLEWTAGHSETIPWEIFRGRLLDAAQTRLQKSFLAWHVHQEDATEPMISVKLDPTARQIHVTRGLLAYVWEAFDAGGGVIESREATRWTRELVGTIPLDAYSEFEPLRDELICLIWQAVVGTSRLPLASIEAPLPAYVFGQLHYAYRDEVESAVESWEAFLLASLRPTDSANENSKLVEFVLRRVTPAETTRLAEIIVECGWGESWPGLLRTLFNGVSLSPWTRLAENALALVDCLAAAKTQTAAKIDFLGHLLRQLGRHLTAYDLVTFHHRGANYPDALLLDMVLQRYVKAIEEGPEYFSTDDLIGRLRRRALRQACLAYRQYEGHLVPDLPTSPGENARVMPASHPRVPEEQLLQSMRRRRQLFADAPWTSWMTENGRQVFAQSIEDLVHVEERIECGLGVFIDRPLGYGKEVGASDLTPLLAHEAFSPSLARLRWRELKKCCEQLELTIDAPPLDTLFEQGGWPAGLSHTQLADCPRPTAALADVRKVADDFTILRTLPGGLAILIGLFDWRPFEAYYLGQMRLCVQTFDEKKQPVLAIYDAQLRRRLELSVDASQGFATRAGVEWPRAGLRVLKIWDERTPQVPLSPAGLWVSIYRPE